MYKFFFKRLLDIIISGFFLIVLCPVLILLAILVRIKLGTPVIFKQDRPGKDEKIFRLYKFRSMTDARDENGDLLSDEIRLTSFGKKLRSTSLDELPELFNILKGDMSLIGPRPLLVSYLPYYSEREKKRHSVRPGLTGLAQVSGRNFIDWDERLQKDVEYVEHLSLGMDIKILFMTVLTVFGQVFGQREEVAENTNAVEGNFAQIRQERLKETGKLTL